MKKNYHYSMQNTPFRKRHLYQYFFPLFLMAALFMSNIAHAQTNVSTNNYTTPVTVHMSTAETGSVLDCDVKAVKIEARPIQGNIEQEVENVVAYSWSGPNGFSSTQKIVTVTEPGLYNVAVTLSTGAIARNTIQISGYDYPYEFAGPDKVLMPTRSTVTLEGYSPRTSHYTYSWKASQGGNIVSGANTLNPVVDTPGTYTITLTSPSGCTMQDAMVVTYESNLLEAKIWSNNMGGFDCNTPPTTYADLKGTALLNGITITEGVTFQWSGPNNFTADTKDTWVNAPGTYTLTVTHNATGQTATASWTFAAPKLPVASAGPDKKLTCANPTVMLEGIMEVGDRVIWDYSEGGNIVSGERTLNPIVDAPGTYTMIVSFYTSTCTARYTVKVTRGDELTVSATGGKLDPTTNAVQLKGSSSAAGATYSWAGPNGFTSTEQNPTVKVAGNYTLTVTDPDTGCSKEAQAVVTAGEDVLVARITNDLPLFGCESESERKPIILYSSITLNGNKIAEGIAYSWTGPNDYKSDAQHASVTVAGTYVLEATHIATGLTSTTSKSVNQYTVPVGSAGPDKKLTCDNPTVTLEGSVINNSGSPSWHAGYEGGNIVSGHKTLNPVVDAPGTYYLVLGSGRCTTLYSVKVTRDEELTVSATGGKLDCTSSSLQLMASSNTEGVTYSWTGPNGYTSTEQNPTVKVAGDYSVTVTNPESGCTATTSVVVTPVSTEMQVTNHMIDFNGQKRGLISSIDTDAGPVAIMGRKRNADGSYEPQNYAAIFDTQDPTADDANLYTVDWAEALIINQYHNDYPDANQWGGELILDFSDIGPVTMESFRVVGMDLYEQMSWVYLYDADGKELHKEYLKPLGINSKQTIDLGNTRGVVKMKIVMDGRNGSGHLSGSAAIDDIKFKVETTTENPCEVVAANITHMKAYPTSFSDHATLEFIVRETDNYSINLYDTQGMLVKQLKQGTARAGELTTVELNGRELKEGMYFAKLVSGKSSHTFKLILKR